MIENVLLPLKYINHGKEWKSGIHFIIEIKKRQPLYNTFFFVYPRVQICTRVMYWTVV